MFYPLEKLHRLHDGYQKAIKVGRHELLLLQDEGRLYLIENRCPHMDAPLTFASVREGVIRCPMHGIEFSLRTGEGRTPAPLSPIKIFTPIYDGSVVGVELT